MGGWFVIPAMILCINRKYTMSPIKPTRREVFKNIVSIIQMRKRTEYNAAIDKLNNLRAKATDLNLGIFKVADDAVQKDYSKPLRKLRLVADKFFPGIQFNVITYLEKSGNGVYNRDGKVKVMLEVLPPSNADHFDFGVSETVRSAMAEAHDKFLLLKDEFSAVERECEKLRVELNTINDGNIILNSMLSLGDEAARHIDELADLVCKSLDKELKNE